MLGPTITRIEPLFKPLGFYRFPSGFTRYYFDINGETRAFRARDMKAVEFLMELYAYPGHWRRLFPAQTRLGIDTREAMGFFVRECHKAGPFDPPAELKPRGVGRPRKTG